MSGVRVANAPLSYGAFEMTVGTDFAVPDPVDVLAAIGDAGFAGTDLGPPGYLGEGDELAARLDEDELEVVGGFVPMRFSERDALGRGPRRPAPHARPVRARPARPAPGRCCATRAARSGSPTPAAAARTPRCAWTPPLGHARRRRRARRRRGPRARLRARLPPPHVDLRRGRRRDRAPARGHRRRAAARQRAPRGRRRRPGRGARRLGRADRGGPHQGRPARRARAA